MMWKQKYFANHHKILAKTEIIDSANWSISEIKFGHHENGAPMQWRILAIDNNLTLLHYTGSDLKQHFHDENIDIHGKIVSYENG